MILLGSALDVRAQERVRAAVPAASVEYAAASGTDAYAEAAADFPWNRPGVSFEQVVRSLPEALPRMQPELMEVGMNPPKQNFGAAPGAGMAPGVVGSSGGFAESVAKRVNIPKKYDITKIGDRGVGGGMNFYSLEKETMMGRELAQEVEATAKLFQDEVIGEYVNRLAQTLVRNSDAKVQFTVKVIDNDEVNAFALPGGFFYVNVGMLMAVENEAELAGVMAHEIAHVAARHATKQATKKDLWSILSIPLVFVGGPAGMIASNVANIAVPMSFLKFSRNAEREADLLGLEYQYAAGYDPAAMVAFFERIGRKEKKRNFLVRAFSSHPMNEDRVKRSQKTMQTLLPPAEEYLVSTSEFDEMKERLAMLTRGRLRIEGPGPTLRKRAEGESEQEDGPPVLKRKD